MCVAIVGSGLSSDPCEEPDEQDRNDGQPALDSASMAADEEAGSPRRGAMLATAVLGPDRDLEAVGTAADTV